MAKWIRSLVVVGALLGMSLGPCSEAHAALNAYLKLKRPGVPPGRDLVKGDAMAVLGASGDESSRDAESGLPTGKEPAPGPFVITRAVDAATPGLYRAMRTGELLPEVELSVYAPEDRVRARPLYTVTLKHVRISRIEVVPHKDPKVGATTEVAFTYGTLVYTWVEGGITGQD